MSEKRAMEISGHKTRSCFERYHIVSLSDIQESGKKMDQWIRALRAAKIKSERPPEKQAAAQATVPAGSGAKRKAGRGAQTG
jgi:hypothetical protein